MTATTEMTDATRAVELVERTITELGLDPTESKRERDDRITYALRRGSARLLVAVHLPTEKRAEGCLRVVAPVVRDVAEDDQRALYRWLLEVNASELVGAAFGISQDEVVVVAERGFRDLDRSEVDAMIKNVGRIADKYDDVIADELGAIRSSDA